MYLVCKDNPAFEETGRLIKAAKSLGIDVLEYRLPDWDDESYFVYGTRNFVLPQLFDSRHILSDMEYLYKYSFLLSIFNWELFNEEASIIPAGKLAGSWMSMSKLDFFIRPLDGNKSFTGFVINGNELKADLTYKLHINKWDLIVVAPAKELPIEEYRFFCKMKEDEIKMVGCRYWPQPAVNDIPNFVTEKARVFASRIFDEMTIGDCFVLDVFVDDERNASVGELNSWNSSAFYSIDPKNILRMIFDC